jgi:hypothetical protein
MIYQTSLPLLREKNPQFVFFTYFLASDGEKSIKVAQVFPSFKAYTDVTAHSTKQITSSLVDFGYESMTATGNYKIEDVVNLSEMLKQLHLGIRIIDLNFSSAD